jgi:hypothetical protein
MGLFKKKPKPVVSELKYPCPAEGCPLVYDDPVTLKRHVDWAHPELEPKEVK